MKVIFLFLLFLLFIQRLSTQQPFPGDINGDGVVNSLDIIRGKQIALNQPPSATHAEISAGDMNSDGEITVQDLVLIRNTIAKANRPPVADATASPDSGLTGTDIQLDATHSYDLDGDNLTYLWRQLHMSQYSTEYMTENKADLSDSTSITPTFNPEWPGNYRFELVVTDAAGLVEKDTVDVLVGKKGGWQIDFKGLCFPDGFFPLTQVPGFDPTPENPDSLAAVQDRVMDAPVRANVEWIGINPAVDYLRINPLPKFGTHPNDPYALKETEYAAIVSAAKSHGLKVFHAEYPNITNTPPLRPGEIDSLEILMETSAAWWEEWFNQLQTYSLDRADWAEKYNVEMFVIVQWADFSFRPELYPQYGDRWRVLIDSVRAHFSGKVGLHVGTPENLNFADALDALFIGLDGAHYVFWYADQIADIHNPTIEELRKITESELDIHESFVGGNVPVYFNFSAYSADAQPQSVLALPISQVDYQEQVTYYEAIIQAIDDEAWVNGFVTFHWDWFDEMDRPGLRADAFTSGSPRSKPAEDVIKLWFGIY